VSESGDPAGGPYAVGYRKPPLHTRFQKGRSGNPSGKQRTSEPERAKSLVRQEVYRLLSVRDSGKLKRIPALRAVIRRLVAAAAQGNLAAQRALLKNIQEIEAEHRAEERATRRVDLNQLTDEQLNRICRDEEPA
jgi:ribosomal protein L17